MPNDIIEHSPLISVGVASYNNSKYILDTLKSIVSQSYKNIELIIVDDCSKDDSVERINEFIKTVSIPVKFHINQQNQGVVNVCNKLLNLLSGTYYTLIGSDDVMLPDRIEKQIKVMISEGADMSFGRITVINDFGEIVNHQKNSECISEHTSEIIMTYKNLLEYNIVPAPTVMLKTRTVKSINGYDITYTIEDLPLWISIASNKYKIVYLNELLVYYRVLANSLNNKITTPLAHYFLVNNKISKFKVTDKLIVRLVWTFKLTGEKEFKNAYKYCQKNTFIYWYSYLNQNRLLHSFSYRFLKIIVSSKFVKNRYDKILLISL
jgi:glycosyltransferase involved in cell wall biosynthesis